MSKLNFHGLKNIRDFSELKNKDGKSIKPNLFFRSNALNKLSKTDIEKFNSKYNLKVIIDLRTETERLQKPDKIISDCERIEYSLLNGKTIGISKEKGIHLSTIKIPDMPELYKSIVISPFSIARLKKIFEIICEAEKYGPMLWHCTEGKDRCGIVSALFLKILDFEDDVIFEDYLKTNKHARFKSKFFGLCVFLLKWNKKQADGIRRAYIADKLYLEAAFSAIKSNFGSIENYLKEQLGISSEMKRKLKKYCLK